MRNTIILSVVLFVAVVAATLYYFRNLDGEHNRAAKPLRYLPDNTLLITAISNNEVSDNIFKDFEVFEAMLGHQEFEVMSQFKTKLLRSEALKKFVDDSEVYISFHPQDKQIETILTIPTSTAITQTEFPAILNELNKQYKISTTDTLDHKIYQLQYGSKDSSLYSIYYNNVFFASKSMHLLTKILDKHSKHLPDDQIDFFLKGDSRNTALSVYFPHQQYDSIVNLYQRKNTGTFLDFFKNMQGQSVWNINFKQDALMLTGESELDQYSENYVSLFKNQEKTSQHLYTYFPSNTAVYMEFSISDRSRFQRDLKDLFKRRKEKIAKEIDTTGVQEQLTTLLGNDIALAETTGSNLLGFITLKDKNTWSTLEGKFLENLEDSIYRFKSSGLLYRQYGDLFQEFPRPYLTKVNDVLILANSSRTLKDYRNAFEQRDFLTGTLGFKNFEKLQGNEANVTLFVHTKNANTKILNSLNPPFQNNFKDKENFGFQDFYSWSVQLSGNSGKFISQLYAIFKSKTALGSTPEWTYAFENKAITKPYVFEQSDTSQFILIQELDHTMHAISPKGQQLWSTVFAGRVVGDIQQLEDRSLLLVTDRNRLYRFDTNGQTLKGFSIGIPDEPISQPTVVTLQGQKVIAIPTRKKVYAFNLDGTPVSNWQTFEAEGNLLGPILVTGNQLAIGTSSGKIYGLGQNGQKVRDLTIKPNIQLKNPIGVLKGNVQPGEFLATDTAGYLYRIPFEGASTSFALGNAGGVNFGDFVHINSSPHVALLVSINNSLLRVYEIADTTRVLFEYNFTKEINDRPQYFQTPNSSNLQIGIASKATNLLYLFKEDGALQDGFPVEGQPLFHYGRINYNGDTYLLCMRRDHKLYAFRHQK
ncbi:PQQ-binding-like beta-propeller repeat protein [Sphingobacterium sp. xlx-130]|uniref:outer membrane protein assembly factor BamB family protein n=1 Tax=Sphingobacterium sp. xlx-130 TaxID=2654323 RepID=UPI0013DD6A94|nr:PQQ-binding-like beta-propeller repeat protein [Sphingobacterium sp. xlx-130]